MVSLVSEVRTANYHVLLVGVDAYTSHPLRGCVNDVDAVQRLLLGPRMGLTPAQIRRLASPHPDVRHDTSVPSEPATLDNLRRELEGLAERVERTDRVFIYYAGHGTRDEFSSDGRRFHCEALVPADWDPVGRDPRLLYDFELNTWLRAIVAKTRSVAMVMDCCHAAGATRDFLDPGDWEPRFLELPRGHGSRSGPPPAQAGLPASAGRPERLAASVEDCQVISACLAHERAQEGRGAGDIRQGLFTRAWLAALDDVPPDVDLTAVTWGRIWQALCAGVQQRNPGQHASLIGHPGRAVFGGPPAEGDTGIPVSLRKEGYRIEIGTLAGVTKGAKLAVYGAEPVFFPRLGSTDDLGARVGVLRVIEEGLATATATAEGSSFTLPSGARARLIEPGQDERLRFAVIPRDADLERQLARAPLLELVEDPVQANVRLEFGDGRWFVTDTLHGTGRAIVPGSARADDKPVLFALQSAELDCARDVLEHYYYYSRPLRVAERAKDLPGTLALRVLHCPQGAMSSAEAQTGALPGAPSRAKRSYLVPSGMLVCFTATNQSPRRLRVTLLNSAASGKVQLLGDEIIESGAHHVFWAGGALGSPFQMTPPRGLERCIDRLVAIGRTSVGHDLSHLRVDRSFADIVQRSRSSSRAAGDRPGEKASVLEHWTASEVIIETYREPGRP